jgi:FKBP-type peptidyl-prolyl cis-trans isomerase FkpA
MMKQTFRNMKIKSLLLYGILLIGGGLGLQGCLGDSENPNAQHDAEVKIIDQYLQSQSMDNLLYDNVLGIRFKIHAYGQGAPVHSNETVVGNYTAYILHTDGTMEQFDFGTLNSKIQNVQPGALAYLASVMLEGSTGTIFSPSRYGFGENGSASLGVPPNSIVVYTLSLTDVQKGAAWEDRLEIDTTAISDYIETKPVPNAIKHPSGFWYTIDKPGSGAFATPYSIVTFDYKLQLLLGSGPGGIIQNSTITSQSTWTLIDGLKLGFREMQEGTEATFYIPSGLGYGDEETSQIPKNSNLVFQIKLTDIQE